MMEVYRESDDEDRVQYAVLFMGHITAPMASQKRAEHIASRIGPSAKVMVQTVSRWRAVLSNRCSKCNSALSVCDRDGCEETAQCGEAWCVAHTPDSMNET